MKKPRILFLHRQTTAVGWYRSTVPARALRLLDYPVTCLVGHDNCVPSLRGRKLPKDAYFNAFMQERIGKYDLLIADRAVTESEWAIEAAYRHRSPGCRMICDLDDLFIDVEPTNKVAMHYRPGGAPREAGLAHLRVSELCTVSTEPLAEALRSKTHAIKVIHNHVDPKDWSFLRTDPARSSDPHLRIFYGGGDSHLMDLEAIRPGLEAVLRDPPVPVRFICFGSAPAWLYDLSVEIPGRVVILPWTPFKNYPQTVAWGGCEVMIAPLRDTPFTRSKSNIKVLEAGLLASAIIASKVGPYASVPESCALLVENTKSAWEAALRAVLTDATLRERLCTNNRAWTLDSYSLEKASVLWQSAVEEAMSRPRIETLADTRLPTDPPLLIEGRPVEPENAGA